MTALNVNPQAHPNGATRAPGRERRVQPLPATPTASPERLVVHQVEQARAQLADARERLKAARRRVVELEDAVANWEEFANEVLRRRR
jgi:uncharacterized membrane protein YccC